MEDVQGASARDIYSTSGVNRWKPHEVTPGEHDLAQCLWMEVFANSLVQSESQIDLALELRKGRADLNLTLK